MNQSIERSSTNTLPTDAVGLMKTALNAVVKGANMAEAALVHLPTVQRKESIRDLVTDADRNISEYIVAQLRTTGYAVMTEEDTRTFAQKDTTFWVLDPIDGTVNFAHGLAPFAVSVGLVANGVFCLGAVCAPKLDELYFTLHEQKALMNGRPFVHQDRSLEQSLLAASFSSKAGAAQYTLFQKMNESTRGCLRTGSAALNICWAASNKLQCAYGFSAKIWDVAGALAIARAAGCTLAWYAHNDGITCDYIVGSRELVEYVKHESRSLQLWRGENP